MESYDIYRKNIEQFLLFWIIPALLGSLLGAWFRSNSPEAGGSETGPEGEDIIAFGEFFEFLQFAIPLMIIILVIHFLFEGGVIAMTLEAVKKGRATTQTGYEVIMRRGLSIIGMGLLFSFIVGIGLVLCFVPGVFFCYWYFFALTIVVLEGCSPGEALSRSKIFSVNQRAFAFIVIVFLVVIGVGWLAGIIAEELSGGSLVLSVLLSGIVSWIIGPYLYIATAYYYIKGRGLDQLDDAESPMNDGEGIISSSSLR